mmetsp:Transcript_21436/g.57643  ORF Transcript_21436/g.57643 Transcript_21436/m.57643 type:complete len:396 (-) Transcript_21436:93-1280(-)
MPSSTTGSSRGAKRGPSRRQTTRQCASARPTSTRAATSTRCAGHADLEGDFSLRRPWPRRRRQRQRATLAVGRQPWLAPVQRLQGPQQMEPRPHSPLASLTLPPKAQRLVTTSKSPRHPMHPLHTTSPLLTPLHTVSSQCNQARALRHNTAARARLLPPPRSMVTGQAPLHQLLRPQNPGLPARRMQQPSRDCAQPSDLATAVQHARKGSASQPMKHDNRQGCSQGMPAAVHVTGRAFAARAQGWALCTPLPSPQLCAPGESAPLDPWRTVIAHQSLLSPLSRTCACCVVRADFPGRCRPGAVTCRRRFPLAVAPEAGEARAPRASRGPAPCPWPPCRFRTSRLGPVGAMEPRPCTVAHEAADRHRERDRMGIGMPHLVRAAARPSIIRFGFSKC